MDPNDIKGGKYVLIAEQWDEYVAGPGTSKPTEPFDFVRHRQGDEVELSKSEARRLVLANAVVSLEDYEKATAEPTAAAPVLDDAGLAALRETLDLPEDADQAAILEALQKPATPASTAPASDKIEDIVKWVGGDSYRARAALAVEQSEKGDQARPQLVKALEEIATAPGGGS